MALQSAVKLRVIFPGAVYLGAAVLSKLSAK
jgi:hypothetical protein